jgi:hypothetical protein
MFHQLRVDPMGWGDPLHRYAQLGLVRCRGINPVLYVYYAVDEARRIVYIQQFFIRPGHALEGSE